MALPLPARAPATAAGLRLLAGPEAHVPLRAIDGQDFTRRVIAVAFLIRLLSLVAGVYGLEDGTVTTGVLLVIALLGITSYLGTARGGRLPRIVVRHPLVAMVDVLLVLLVVYVVGVNSPLVFATFSTALLVGVVFPVPVAVLFGIVLVGGYTATWQATGASPGDLGFPIVFGTPLLYLCLIWVGAAVRSVYAEQVDVMRALATSHALRTAAEERARLAREMHDSLAKTLHGIALGASALPVWVRRDPDRAAEAAEQLANDAERAAREARQILERMRADEPDRPLAQVLGERCRAFAAEHGGTCTFTASEVVDLTSDVRYEVIAVIDEALRNVARHAQASEVTVSLDAVGNEAEVVVRDNGRGFVPPAAGSRRRGHYGLEGMHERATVAGGRLQVESTPATGTLVRLLVPRGDRA